VREEDATEAVHYVQGGEFLSEERRDAAGAEENIPANVREETEGE